MHEAEMNLHGLPGDQHLATLHPGNTVAQGFHYQQLTKSHSVVTVVLAKSWLYQPIHFMCIDQSDWNYKDLCKV